MHSAHSKVLSLNLTSFEWFVSLDLLVIANTLMTEKSKL